MAAAVGSARAARAKALCQVRSLELVKTQLDGIKGLDVERLRRIAESANRRASAHRGLKHGAAQPDAENEGMP